jgi:hypothetical protein
MVVLTAEVDGLRVRFAADPACQLHGGVVRVMQRHTLQGLSVPKRM